MRIPEDVMERRDSDDPGNLDADSTAKILNLIPENSLVEAEKKLLEEAAEIENRPMSGSKIVGQSTQNSDKVDRADRDAPCETGKTVSKSALSSSCALLGGHDESGSLLISASQLQLSLDTAVEKAVNSLGSSGKGSKDQISSCIYSSGESIKKAEMHATEMQSLESKPCY